MGFKKGHSDIAVELLEKGADVEAKDRDSNKSLLLAWQCAT